MVVHIEIQTVIMDTNNIKFWVSQNLLCDIESMCTSKPA